MRRHQALKRVSHQPRRNGRHRPAVAVTTVLVALTAVSGQASAGTWEPNLAKATAVSTAFNLQAMNEGGMNFSTTCPNVTMNGTLKENSTTWTIKPALNCLNWGSTGNWTAMDENMTQAAFKIPTGVKTEIEITAGCKLVFENVTVTQANNYINGLNGRAQPSIWRVNNVVGYVEQNPAKCFRNVEAGNATMIATFLVVNNSSAATPIKVK